MPVITAVPFVQWIAQKQQVPVGHLQWLARRQCETVRPNAGGKTTKEIAAVLNISTKTVDVHRSNIMQKLDLHNAAKLVHYAIRTKLINP